MLTFSKIQKCVLSARWNVFGTILRKASSDRGHIAMLMRSFHASVFDGHSNQVMKRLSNKRKKKWYITPQPLPTFHIGFLKPVKKRRTEDSLRVRMLNMIVFKAVSDLLSSHEVNDDIPSYNIELTKVSLLADYSACHIYWKTSLSSERDGQIQQALARCGTRIRYLVTSQQIVGSMPHLVFIPDKQYASLKEVENLLRIADFGPADEILVEKDLESTAHMVGTRKNMFGVDHDTLHKQIEYYKQKSRDTRALSTSLPTFTQDQLDVLAEIRKQKLIEKKKCNAKKQKDDITPKEFLLARQLQKEENEAGETQFREDNGQASELMDERKY